MAEQNIHSKKVGVILVNLGSPQAATPKAVRSFLKPFLGDFRVVEIPRLLWLPILYGIVLPLRSRKSAKKYAQIWWPEGSPLRVITQRQVDTLQACLDNTGGSYLVTKAYTYGEPSLPSAIEQLEADNVDEIVILPLYPQYSATSTGPVLDQLGDYFQAKRNVPTLSYVRSYYDHDKYIDALAQSVKQHWQQYEQADVLLMSFHGIPQACVDKGDPYQQECEASAKLLAEKLGLEKNQWQLSYQSRLGAAQWLLPSTSDSVQLIAKNENSSVQIICPGFSVDCLETLEEIEIENAEIYKAAGGTNYQYIPCLNDSDNHIQMMAELIRTNQSA